MKPILLFCGLLCPLFIFAQRNVEGIIYDVITKQRLGEVQVRNLNTKQFIYNDAKGEFSIFANPGDPIQFKKLGYHADTVIFTDQAALIINLKEAVNKIQEISIYGRRNPDEVLAEMQRDYKKAFDLAAPKDYISVGPTGVGLSIDALYSKISREAKNARRFTEFIGKVHEENIIDYRFTPELVRSLIGLEGEELKKFMQLFRPTYEFIATATHYKLVAYIKSKYEIYKLHPNIGEIKLFPDIKLDVKKDK